MKAGRGTSNRYWLVALVPLLGICAWFMGLTSASVANAADQVVTTSDYAGKWNGVNGSERTGDIVVNAGDINDDGFDDFMTMVDGAANRGVYVFFGPGQPTSPDLANLDPSDGYRIKTPVDALWPTSVGDQNNDGVPDMVVAPTPNGSVATVLYGVKNPAADLAQCNPPNVTVCLSTDDPVDVDGDRLGFKLTNSVSMVATSARWDSGDFDGDGKDELLVPTGNNGNSGRQALVLANGLGSNCPASPGLCTIDLTTLSAPDVIQIAGLAATVPFGNAVVSPGDVNGDGRDDLAIAAGTDGSVQPALWVIYGQDWTGPVDVTAATSADGYKVDLPYTAISSFPFAPGDVNGDGLADVGVQGLEAVPTLGTFFTVIYGKEGTPERTLTADPPAVGDGIQFDWDSSFPTPPIQGTSAGALPVSLGDLNGDGADEFGTSAPNTAVNSKANAGRVIVFQGGVPADMNRIVVGAATPTSEALMLGGDAASLRLGTGLAPAGDVDGDGVGDLALGATGFALTTPSPLSNVGLLATVSSARYYPQGSTGIASVSGIDAATVGGVANANRRASTASFEYGTTKAYGQQSADQPIGASGLGRGVEADLTGLDEDTEYHYRLVVENDLGVKAYGADRTFKTAKTPVDPPTGCDLDDTGYGCAKFCEAHPDSKDCIDPVAGLSDLIASSSASKARRGGKVVVRTWITSTGTKAASGVKVCASGPKRLVRIQGKACRSFGNVAPGRTVKAQFTVKVKPKAKRRARAALKFVATSQELGNKTAQVKVAIR
ncbi:MAG: FG-GAP repeat protein [Solirubrobacterales bacterium]|nr:FG-GAP repeat protein [Solirubrobacterales bacterium]